MSQRQRIKKLLMDHPNMWVPLYHFLDLTPRIANYRSRITELRRSGMNIVNENQLINGIRHSCYKWVVKEEQKSFC